MLKLGNSSAMQLNFAASLNDYVFDEIQDCPRAIQSLKYFCENMPELHVIAAGSLLGVALRKEGISFPVGKVDRIEMHPMSFEEFVIADGGEKYIKEYANWNYNGKFRKYIQYH